MRRDKARGEAIAADVLARIRGTELDTGTYLDKLKKLSLDEMSERIDGGLILMGLERELGGRPENSLQDVTKSQ